MPLNFPGAHGTYLWIDDAPVAGLLDPPAGLFTIAAWIYPTNLTGTQAVFNRGQLQFNTGFGFGYRSGVWLNKNGNDFSSGAMANLVNNVWVCIAAIVTTTNITFCTVSPGGILTTLTAADAGTVAAGAANTGATIGAYCPGAPTGNPVNGNPNNDSFGFIGDIANVAIWRSQALTTQQVRAWAMGNGSIVPTPAFYVELPDSPNTEIRESVGLRAIPRIVTGKSLGGLNAINGFSAAAHQPAYYLPPRPKLAVPKLRRVGQVVVVRQPRQPAINFQDPGFF